MIPPAIHALLAARLDRLEPSERSVLEGAAIAGDAFQVAGLKGPSCPRSEIWWAPCS